MATGGAERTGTRQRRAPIVILTVVLLAGAVIGGAVLTTHGAGGSGSPVATARGFSLPAAVRGEAAVALSPVPGHPVLLTFFASWCQPCIEELPLIEGLSQTWARQGSAGEVVGVDELDQRPEGPDLVRRTGVTFPAGYDHDGSVGKAWGINGLPITVAISPDGRVVEYHRGALSSRQLDALVKRLAEAGG